MPAASERLGRWEVAGVAAMLGFVLLVFAQLYLPFLPNDAGRIASDYSLFLPDMLVGYYWYLHNGLFSIPWFSPAQCGGVPYFPDPQVAFYALPQLLTLLVSPLAALRVNFMVFAAIGFVGAYGLARLSFRTSMPAALLAAALFMFNGLYSSRMLVGHLTFHPYMLLPLLAASLLPGAGRPAALPATLRIGLAGFCLGYMMQAGMLHILPPTLLSLLIVTALWVGRFGGRWFPFAGLAASVAVGLLLSGGKLAAFLAFIAQFPRTDYPLPGIASLGADVALAFRTLFFAVPDDAPQAITNTMWAESQHEWEYGVSPVPLGLMLAMAGLWLARRRTGLRVSLAQALLLAGMGVLLAIPIAVNWYQPAWNGLLKSLPLFGNSSNLLRWFCAYMLPAILGGALALDGLCARLAPGGRGRATLAAACIAAVLGVAATKDLSYYGAAGTGAYDVAAIQSAYARAAATGGVPAIDSVVVLMDAGGHVVMNAQRDDTLTRGHSQLLCYQPIFGYRLEHFPIGPLHPGPALSEAHGVLNFKNPACYVFPRQNSCVPGAQFDAGAVGQARDLLDYRPYAFHLPLYARLANWLSVAAVLGWLGVMLGAGGLWAWRSRALRRAGYLGGG